MTAILVFIVGVAFMCWAIPLKKESRGGLKTYKQGSGHHHDILDDIKDTK